MIRVIVPYAARSPKTRLSSVLSEEERRAFAMAMLADVTAAISAAGRSPEVLATASIEVDAPVLVDERPLTPAINDILDRGGPVAIVMADLALATPTALSRFFDAPGDVVLAPGRAGGTNAIVARHPSFRVDYHGASYLDHLAIAHDIGASVFPIDSHRLATDIDEPDDLVELLVHGEGRAREWLVDAGFTLAYGDRRVGIDRA